MSIENLENDIPPKEEEKKLENREERIFLFDNTTDQRIIEQLVKIQEDSLPENSNEIYNPEEVYTAEEIREFISDKDNILIVLAEGNNACGFAMAVPYEKAYYDYELFQLDNGMEVPTSQKKLYYSPLVVVSPSRRKRSDYFKLVRALADEIVHKRGINILSMHAKKDKNYSKRVQRLCENTQLRRTITNWSNTGKDVDYLEMNIQENDFVNLDKLLSRRIKSA